LDLKTQHEAARLRAEAAFKRYLAAVQTLADAGIGAVNLTPAQRKEVAAARRESAVSTREFSRLEKEMRAAIRAAKKKPDAGR